MNNSSKTWSGFWSGLIWFVLGLVCITICQFVAVFILVAIETVQQGSRLSEDRVSELFLDGDLLAIASVLILPVMFIMLAFAVKVRRKKPLLDFLGFREVTIPVLATWSLYAVAVLVAIFICDRLFGRPTVPEWMLTTFDSVENIWLFSLSIVVLGPISEELLYRGYIIRVWAESVIGPIVGTVLLSVMWAAIHFQYDSYEMAWVFILGLLLCVSRLQTKSIVPAIVIHISWNAVSLAMLFYHRAA